MSHNDNLHDLSDEEIWKKLKAGDEYAFSFIIDQYIPILNNYGKKVANHQVMVEDSIQDLLVEIWEKRGRLGDVKNIKSYLLSSLRRKLLRKINKVEYKSLDHVEDDFTFKLEWSYETRLIEKQHSGEKYAFLAKTIEELPERQKEAIYLKFYENLSYEDIATSMDISVNAVYKAVSNAMKFLRKNISNISVIIGLPVVTLFSLINL